MNRIIERYQNRIDFSPGVRSVRIKCEYCTNGKGAKRKFLRKLSQLI